MATVIIDVDISPANAAQKANELLTSMQKIKDQQTILIATGQKQTQEYANNTTALKKLTQEQKAYTIIAENAEGSNNQLRAQLTLLTNQYNALSREERENTTAGKALQAQTRAISDELKGNEKAVGDNRRNVGNYRDVLNEASAAGIPFAGSIQNAVSSMSALGGIIPKNISLLKALKIAVMSTGIGALIVLLTGLINYLSKFDPVIDRVEQAISGMSAAFEVVIQRVLGFFQGITSLGDALTKIGNVIKNPIRSFKELGNSMNEAASAAANLVKAQQDLEDQVKLQDVANARAEQRIQQLLLQSRNLSLSEKERQKFLKEANKLEEENFNQRTKIANEQVKQAQQDIANIAGVTEADVKRLKEEGLAYAFILKDRVRLTDDQVDALKEAELAKINILRESTNRQEKIQNLNDKLAEQAAAAAEKRAAAKIKADEEQAKANEALVESQTITNNFLVDARQQEINNINLDIQKKIELYQKYGATTEQLEKERTARLLALSAQYAKEDQKQIETYLKEQENLLVSGIQNETDRKFAQAELQRKRNIESIDKEIVETEDRIKKGDIRATAVLIEQLNTKDAIIKQNSIEREQQLKDQYDIELELFNQHQVDLAEAQVISAGSEAEQLMARQTLLEAMYQQDIDMAIKTGTDTTLITAQYEEEKRQINEDTLNSAFTAFKSFSTNFQKLVGENTLAYKIAGEVQARVDAAQSLRNNILIIQENVKALSSQGKLPFPYNLVAIFSTLAALASAASAAKTIFSMPKGFAEGGQFVSDGKGSVLPGYSKHDNINARLRSGEGVVVSEAMKDPAARNAISAINVAYGGRDFSVPNYTGGFATGGIAQGGYVTSLSDSVNQSNDISNAIVRGLIEAPPAIVDVRQIITESQKAFAVKVKQNI